MERASKVLPAPGGPTIKHVVHPGSRHLQRALDVLLTFDLGKIGLHVDRQVFWLDRRLGRDLQRAGQVRDQGGQSRNRDDLQVGDQGRFGCICKRSKDALEALLAGQSRHRQHAAHMPHAAIQRKLAHHQRPLHAFVRELTAGDQRPQGNGQIVGRTFFAHRGRRQVDSQTLAREKHPGIFDGRLDTLAAFLHRGVR